jgi:rod shape-determining protein MreC
MRINRAAAQRRQMLALAILLVLLTCGLAVWQVRARAAEQSMAVQSLLRELFVPPMRAATLVHDSLRPEPDATISTDISLTRYQQLEQENADLRRALALRDYVAKGKVAAEVIGRGNAAWQGFLQLGKGSADGVEPNMVALAPDGFVGRVTYVTAHTAEVLPITDQTSGVGAMTSRGKAFGVLKGYRDGRARLVYLSGQADVKAGDQVVTSGLGLHYPRGLLLGTIAKVEQDPGLSSRIATVTPAADPAQVEVVVLVKY